MPNSMALSSQESGNEDLQLDESSSETETTTSTPLSSQEDLCPPQSKKVKHSDPLDDSIFTKRIGVCTYNMYIHKVNRI